MSERKKYSPQENNLGQECRYWDLGGTYKGCNYPKIEMCGRTSCEGIIDEMCLFLKDGRTAKSVLREVLSELKTQPSSPGTKHYIPASSTDK